MSSTTGSGSDTIVVNASSSLLDGVGAEFNLVVDGTVIGSATTGSTLQAFTFNTTLTKGVAHQIQIVYTNDDANSTQDRNLYLQSIAVNGLTVLATSSLESYSNVNGQTFKSNGNMYWDGTATFALPASDFPMTTGEVLSAGTGSDTIVVNASASLFNGYGAQFNVEVDGKVVGSAVAGTSEQAFTFNATLTKNVAHNIQIVFTNDASSSTQDRNLNLQSISVNGTTIAATSPLETYKTIYGTTYTSTGQMHQDGTATFALPARDFPSSSSSSSTGSSSSTSSGSSSGSSSSSSSSAPGYYVSTSGNDSTGNGSAADPFATLARAQQAMESSSIHTTYIENGTYSLSSNLNLTSADDGMSFIAAAGATPVITGSNSLANLITLNGTTNFTLEGLTFENTIDGQSEGAVALVNANNNTIVDNLFSNNDRGILLTGSDSNVISGNEINNSNTAGINLGGGSNSNTIESNEVNGTGFAGTGTQTAGIWLCETASDNTITHNLVENTGGAGIAVENWDASASDANVDNTISYNSVVNADSSSSCTDSGGIYIDGEAGVNTGDIINNNSVSMATSPTTGIDADIYLDDFTSGVTVTNNILSNGNLSIQEHGGEDNVVSNNILNIGTRSASTIGAALLQGESGGSVASMTGDVVSKNIIYSTATSSPTAWVEYSGGAGQISDNLYYNTNGKTFSTSPDSDAQSGNPDFTNAAAGNYALGSGSAASEIGFQSINQSSIGLAPTTAHWYS